MLQIVYGVDGIENGNLPFGAEDYGKREPAPLMETFLVQQKTKN